MKAEEYEKRIAKLISILQSPDIMEIPELKKLEIKLLESVSDKRDA